MTSSIDCGPEIGLEVDSVGSAAWDELLDQFDDASICQTTAYATAAKSENRVSHLLLKAGCEVIAGCQIRLKRVPGFGIDLADVKWGPIIDRKDLTFRTDIPKAFIRALKEEYGIKRGCLLRIEPYATGDRKDQMRTILEAEGFTVDRSERPYRTLMLDLSPPLEEIRMNLLQRWRRHLNKAEKGSLRVVEGTGDQMFEVFLNLAAEMCERKSLSSLANYEHYRRIQQELPDEYKMRIMVCQHEGNPVAVTIGSAIGNTGIYMLGATGQAGLRLDASYLVHWRMMEWFKSEGMKYYDLGAINPQLNPGGYYFKQGIAGKAGWDETFPHRYHGCFNQRSRLVKRLIQCRELVRKSD